MWEAATAGDPETGWLGRLVGTAVVVGTLVTTRVPDGEGWVWACLALAAACWFVFVLADPRVPGWPLVALVVGAVAATVTVAATGDGSGVAIAYTALIMTAMHPAMPPPATLGVAALVCAVLVAGAAVTGGDGSVARAASLVAIAAFVTLSGLLRRAYHVRAAETVQLLEQTRRAQAEHARAAALDERTRIARELHDVLAHSLGALGVQLEVAEALLAERGDVEGALDRVSRSRRLAADGLDEARAAVAALRRDALPLPAAIAELALAHGRDHLGPAPFVEVVGEPRPVGTAAGVTLAGVAREALTNAARHAPGAPLRVVLEFGPDVVGLAVRNSATAAPDPPAGQGNGLTGMRERLALVGGSLSAGPDESGWAVLAEVPGA